MRSSNDNLLHAFAPEAMGGPETNGATMVVIALRADFYSHCERYGNLRTALERHQKFIGSMDKEELRRAIEEPAKLGSWEIEPGLVGQILSDIGQEEGALPFLSHALLETWVRRRGRTLTLEGYTDSGGVREAIAKTDEVVFANFTPEQETIARNIILRLIELGEDTQVTRRRVPLAELILRPQDAPAVEAVLKALADARLITTGKETVEIAHDTLIRGWRRLQEWVKQDRDALRIRARLTGATAEWERNNRDASYLYGGRRLVVAEVWMETHAGELNEFELTFLHASRAEQERRKRADTRRTQWTITGLAMGLLIVSLLALLAFNQGQQARSEANTRATAEANAVAEASDRATAEAVARYARSTAQAEVYVRATAEANARQAESLAEARRQEAEKQTRIALSRQFAVQSANELNADRYEVALLLAIEAGRMADTVEAFTALRQAFAHPGHILAILSHTENVIEAKWNADESRILTRSGSTVQVWDAATGAKLFTLFGHKAGINQVAWNADESRILTYGQNGTVQVWDAETGAELMVLSGVKQTAWNADRGRILTVSDDGAVRQYYTRMEDLLKAACQYAVRNLTREEWQTYLGNEPYRPTCPNLPVPKE